MNPNVRKLNETQAEFRLRRKIEVKVDRIREKWRVLWPARNGTYVRKLHGDLK